MARQEKPRYTAEEYLALERASSEKNEFAFGEIYAVGWASARQVAIVTDIVAELQNELRQRPCHIYATDLRLGVHAQRRHTYPAVVVACGPPQLLHKERETPLNPDLIVEVLSQSTRNYDRGDKFPQYRGIPSFCEYLLVDQARARVERYTEQGDGTWSRWETDSLSETVRLNSVGTALPLSAFYLKSISKRPANPNSQCC